MATADIARQGFVDREKTLPQKAKFRPLEESKLRDYKKRSAGEWRSRIKAGLSKINTKIPEGTKTRNRYLNLQNRYLIKVIQDEEVNGVKTEKSIALRNLVLELNEALFQKFKNKLNKFFISKFSIDGEKLEQLKSNMNLSVIETINNCITNYNETYKVLPSTYMGTSVEKILLSVMEEFIDQYYSDKTVSLSAKKPGNDRELGCYLADPKAEKSSSVSDRIMTIEDVRQALEHMPAEWPNVNSSKKKFPINPSTLLAIKYGINISNFQVGDKVYDDLDSFPGRDDIKKYLTAKLEVSAKNVGERLTQAERLFSQVYKGIN